MILRIVSDLHLDFHRDNGKSLLAEICHNAKAADVLVMAGDLTEVRDGVLYTEAVKRLCGTFPHVVAVVGNHEYYNGAVGPVDDKIRALATAVPNFHLLDGSAVEISGQRFIGGALWFRNRPDNYRYQGSMSDFRVIRDFNPWVYNTHKRQADYLQTEAKPTDVVVSHHMPTHESVAMRFVGQPMNRFFVADLPDVMNAVKPKVWVHGHTHEAMDYTCAANGVTRIVCNPFGYPGERGTSFVPNKDIAV